MRELPNAEPVRDDGRAKRRPEVLLEGFGEGRVGAGVSRTDVLCARVCVHVIVCATRHSYGIRVYKTHTRYRTQTHRWSMLSHVLTLAHSLLCHCTTAASCSRGTSEAPDSLTGPHQVVCTRTRAAAWASVMAARPGAAAAHETPLRRIDKMATASRCCISSRAAP